MTLFVSSNWNLKTSSELDHYHQHQLQQPQDSEHNPASSAVPDGSLNCSWANQPSVRVLEQKSMISECSTFASLATTRSPTSTMMMTERSTITACRHSHCQQSDNYRADYAEKSAAVTKAATLSTIVTAWSNHIFGNSRNTITIDSNCCQGMALNSLRNATAKSPPPSSSSTRSNQSAKTQGPTTTAQNSVLSVAGTGPLSLCQFEKLTETDRTTIERQNETVAHVAQSSSSSSTTTTTITAYNEEIDDNYASDYYPNNVVESRIPLVNANNEYSGLTTQHTDDTSRLRVFEMMATSSSPSSSSHPSYRPASKRRSSNGAYSGSKSVWWWQLVLAIYSLVLYISSTSVCLAARQEVLGPGFLPPGPGFSLGGPGGSIYAHLEPNNILAESDLGDARNNSRSQTNIASHSTVNRIIKCRAAVAWAPGKSFSIEEVEVAPPQKNEVRVKIVATGVCQSDISFLNGLLPGYTTFPVILGHEGAGIVESVGDGVTDFKEGDHVIPLYMPQCFQCPGCRNPKSNQCLKLIVKQSQGLMQDGTTRFTCKGQAVHHSMGTSTFSEYTVVNDVALAKINKEAPLETVCLIGCAIGTGYGAALNTAKVEPGSRCAVWGLGGIGLAAVMGCRLAGASKIYGIDINPAKFDMAKKFGCTDVLNPLDFEGKKFADVLTQLTGGGFDYTFECIGNVGVMKDALESANRFYGTTVLIGVSGHGKIMELTPSDIITGRTLKGSMFGGWRGVEDVPKLVDEYMSGKIMVDEFITHKLKLDDINTSLELMRDGKCIRCVIHY